MQLCKRLKGIAGLLACAVGLLAGCQLLPDHKDDFGKRNDDFMLRMRWRNVAGAAMYFMPEPQKDFLERFEGDDDLKVTAFTAERLEEKLESAEVVRIVHYQLEYYRMPRMVVQKKRFTMNWRKTAESEEWLIAEPFPRLD